MCSRQVFAVGWPDNHREEGTNQQEASWRELAYEVTVGFTIMLNLAVSSCQGYRRVLWRTALGIFLCENATHG